MKLCREQNEKKGLQELILTIFFMVCLKVPPGINSDIKLRCLSLYKMPMNVSTLG